jgi:hypothetical protein
MYTLFATTKLAELLQILPFLDNFLRLSLQIVLLALFFKNSSLYICIRLYDTKLEATFSPSG